MMEDCESSPQPQVPQGYLHPSQDKISPQPQGDEEGKGGALSRQGNRGAEGQWRAPSPTI